MSRPKITDTETLIREYQSGVSMPELAAKYEASVNCISRWLRVLGCPKRSVSESQRLRYRKFAHPQLGKKHSEETRAKMRAHHADVAGEKNPNFGKGLFGSQNPNWQGGVTVDSDAGRNTTVHLEWKSAVLARDKYECQLCHERDQAKLVTHHIRNWRTHKDLRFVLGNGITLCGSCHGKVSRREAFFAPIFDQILANAAPT